jgi:hypothetical protein
MYQMWVRESKFLGVRVMLSTLSPRHCFLERGFPLSTSLTGRLRDLKCVLTTRLAQLAVAQSGRIEAAKREKKRIIAVNQVVACH